MSNPCFYTGGQQNNRKRDWNPATGKLSQQATQHDCGYRAGKQAKKHASIDHRGEQRARHSPREPDHKTRQGNRSRIGCVDQVAFMSWCKGTAATTKCGLSTSAWP